MPTKIIDTNDLDRGKRLLEERKKIWVSRDDFQKETGMSARSLENWENKGIDISALCLKEIAKRGGNINYILTGIRAGGCGNSAQGEIIETLAGCSRLSALIFELEQKYRETAQYPLFASAMRGIEANLRLLQDPRMLEEFERQETGREEEQRTVG